MLYIPDDHLVFVFSDGAEFSCSILSVIDELLGVQLNDDAKRTLAIVLEVFHRNELQCQRVSTRDFSRSLENAIKQMGYELVNFEIEGNPEPRLN